MKSYKLTSILLGCALFLATEAAMANAVDIVNEDQAHNDKKVNYTITNEKKIVCEGEVTLGMFNYKGSSCNPLNAIEKGTDLKITVTLGGDTLCDKSFSNNPKKKVKVTLKSDKSCMVTLR